MSSPKDTQLPLTTASPVLGHRIQCEARDLQPGDFTTFTGYRCAVDVRPASQRRMRLVRADGTSDLVPRSQLVTVYRHGC